MKKTSGIYKITSTVHPERFYIGSSVSLHKRKSEHFSDLKKGIHPNPKLTCHVNKYGVGDLSFVVVEYCNKEVLIHREQFYIDTLNPWFNIAQTAGTTRGIKFSKESIKRRIDRVKRKVLQFSLDGEFIKEWDSPTDAAKELCINRKGIYEQLRSPQRLKSSQGYIWRYKDEYNNEPVCSANGSNKRPILQYSKDGDFVKEWESARSAALYYKRNDRNITNVCRGFHSTVAGFMWKYKEGDIKLKIPPFISVRLTRDVYQHTLDGELIKKWDCMSEAERVVGISESMICLNCRGKYKTAGGYIWSYEPLNQQQ